MWDMEPGMALVKSCPVPLVAALLARVTEA
jgi:hypothetical protein